MAAPAQLEKPSAEVIGQAFADQYYTVLQQSPALVYRFYQDISKLSRPEDGSSLGLTTGMEEINAKIQSYGTLKAEITSVDSQESYGGGVVVLITGYMVEDGKRQGFTQTFFLAPQEVGYFVLNDIFRYLEDDQSQMVNESLANGVAALDTSDQEISPVQHDDIVGQIEEVNGGEVYDPSEDGEGSVVEQEEPEPVAEVVNEVQTVSEAVVESQTKVIEPEIRVIEPEIRVIEREIKVVESETKAEAAQKKSYASIVKVMRPSGTQIPAPASLKSKPKTQHQQVSATPPPASLSENTETNSNVVDDGSNQEGEGESFSIYVKNLPLNATHAMLEEAFKKFGPIKSGGIQVRNSKGFGFGFVEFEGPDAAQKAVEAGSVIIDGHEVGIEEKRSTSFRGNRGRFPPGRGGGFRNEGPRGRGGSYGRGRGYGRGEFVRSDYGNRSNSRGGYQRSNSDGYQRSNSDGYQRGEMGNGGARVSRGGYANAPNIVEKAQRVSPAV